MISTQVKVGDNVSKGEEMGRFQYGGSEILTLFERGLVGRTAERIGRNMLEAAASAV